MRKRFLVFLLCFFVGILQGQVCVSDHVVDDDVEVSRSDNIPKTHLAYADDDYLTGYVQSLIDTNYYEFRVRVLVKDRCAYLFCLPRNELMSQSIICFVADVPCLNGVQRVDCSPEEFFGCCPPHARPLPYCQVRGVWFPQNTVLFQPFIADPRQPTNSAALRFNDNVVGKHVGAVSFGDIIPFFRWIDIFRWHGDLEIGLEGSIFAVFDLDNPQACMVNTDYYIAARLAYAVCKWSYRFRWWHLSSHLGDEFMIHNPDVERKNVSGEAVDLFASYQMSRAIRVYGGVGYVYRRDKEFPHHPLYLAYGTEVKVFGCRDLYNKLHIQPFLAMFFRNWEENGFDFDQTYALGVEFGKIQGVGRKLRLFAEYHEGHSLEGQFIKERSNYVAIRMTYGF